ncbi:MAG: conjugal transfer protein TraG N-terminal domain-containing protein [Rickettsiaceae bacterium]|nr:conjugal transfer protein TraG N-terminal domain-containing protein [Rickettsiaceae bacterium]
MSQIIIYSYGMAEFTAEVLNAVAATVNNVGFDTALKAMFLAASFAAACSYVINKNVATLVKSTILYIFVTTLLIMPKVTVHIKDDISRNDFVVGNVPIGLALPAHLVSGTFFGLTRLVETAFHQKDDISYSKTGYLFASHVVRNASQVKIIDSEFKKSLNSYLEQCVFYDIYLGAYTLEQLLRTDDIWGLVTTNASANRSFMLDNKVVICREGVKELQSRFDNSAENAIGKYAKLIFPTHDFKESKNNKQLKDTFLLSVASGYDYLTGLSKDGVEILKQNIMINAIQDAALNNTELGMYSYAVTRASAQKAFANNTTGLMMARWLPAMAGATETMIYALFILVVLYSLFTNGEKVFFNYLMTMVWVGSWPVVYAILNFGFTWVIKMKSYGSGLSFYDSSALTQTQYDMASLFGYFTILVPYIAWGMMNLAKQGLGSAFTQMSQLVGNSTQSYAMAASGEAVTGSYSLGNTSFNNHSMANTSAFKHNTDLNYSSGMMSSVLPSGSQVTQTVGGSGIVNMESGISRLNTGINLASRTSAGATEQADKSLNVTKNDQVSYSENMNSMTRDLYEIGHQINLGTTTGESFSKNTSGGYSQAAAEYAVAIDKFANDNNMSKQDAGKFLVGAYGNISGTLGWNSKDNIAGWIGNKFTGANVNVQGTVGGKVDYDRVRTSQDAENYSKAQEFLTNNNLTATFDKAIKGIEENSYRSDLREGANLSKNMSSSLDNAIQSSKSYSAHLQESQSYREIATYNNEHSGAINYNANQEFLEYVTSQPLHSGKGSMGVNQAETLLRTDDKLRNSYAEQFIMNKVESSLSSWKAEHINKTGVDEQWGKYKDSITDMNNTKTSYEANKSILNATPAAKNINKQTIDESIKDEVKNIISNSDEGIGTIKDKIFDFGKLRKDEVDTYVKPNVEIKDDNNLSKNLKNLDLLTKDK